MALIGPGAARGCPRPICIREMMNYERDLEVFRTSRFGLSGTDLPCRPQNATFVVRLRPF